MTECDEIAANMDLTKFKSWVECRAYVTTQMLETSATIRANVAEALWVRYKTAWPVDPFQRRVLEAAGSTRTGAVLRAVFGEPNGGPGTFGRSASVTSDGYLMSDYTDQQGTFHVGAFVGSADDLALNIQRLIAHMKLDAKEAARLKAAVNGWISKDWRFKNDIFS